MRNISFFCGYACSSPILYPNPQGKDSVGRSSLDTHGDHVCRVSVLVVILLLVSSLCVYCLGQKCSTSS